MTAAQQAIEQRAGLLSQGIIIRFCNYCGGQIEDQKRARKSPYCSAEHRRLAVNEKRDLRGKTVCKLCGKRNRAKVKTGEKSPRKGVATVATVSA